MALLNQHLEGLANGIRQMDLNGVPGVPANGAAGTGGRDYPQYASLRDAAETIPPFDGSNISIFQFSNMMRRARTMIAPGAEYALAQMIRNKLFGSAQRAVLSRDADTIEDMITVLMSRFAPFQNTPALLGELAKVSQRPGESTIDFGSRVGSLLQQIHHGYRMEVPEHFAQYNVTSEANAVKSFLTGLRPEIHARIRSVDFADLEEAIRIAVRAEAEYKDQIIRARLDGEISRPDACFHCQGYGHEPDACGNVASRNPRISHVQWQHKICQICNKPGHFASECRTLNTRNANFSRPNNYNSHFNARPSQLFCRYCKNSGHTIEECRKRQFSNHPSNDRSAPRQNSYSNNNSNNNYAMNRGYQNHRNNYSRDSHPYHSSHRRDSPPRSGNFRQASPPRPGNEQRGQRNDAPLNTHPRVRQVNSRENDTQY